MIGLALVLGFGVGAAHAYMAHTLVRHVKSVGYSVWRFEGIERMPPEFLRTLATDLLALGVDPNAALSVMKHESNFNPQAKNEQVVDGKKRLIAGGLIQWINSTAKHYGTSLDALLKMDAMGQLPFVVAYWKTMAKEFPSMKGRWTPEQALRAVFFPSSVGKPDGHVIGNRDEVPKDDSDAAAKKAKFIVRVYEQNRGLDKDGDGKITAGEVDASAKKVYAAAKGRTPLLI
jgi:hypothetical protein